jgi:nucleotide-binding universal stress UspA family protein
MEAKIIVSYDDTIYDVDALALGRALGDAGAEVALAFVRHAHEERDASEEVQRHHAETLLTHGADWLGKSGVRRHIVLNASTGAGLAELAEREHASVIVFGADYRTAPGLVAPGTAAARLLDGGGTAVALAPAGFRSLPRDAIANVAVAAGTDDPAATETAESLARQLGVGLVAAASGPRSLLVVGSRREAPAGRVLISAASEYAIETANFPVLVVPRGVPVRFGAAALVA